RPASRLAISDGRRAVRRRGLCFQHLLWRRKGRRALSRPAFVRTAAGSACHRIHDAGRGCVEPRRDAREHHRGQSHNSTSVGARWRGPGAGLASAALAALNAVHIFFSRTALTDILLCFWVILAVYLFWEAETTRGRAALIGAGLSTGLSWWTKYNGWLPLAICVAGLIMWRLLSRGRETGAGYATRVNQRLRPLARSPGIWRGMGLVASFSSA